MDAGGGPEERQAGGMSPVRNRSGTDYALGNPPLVFCSRETPQPGTFRFETRRFEKP